MVEEREGRIEEEERKIKGRRGEGSWEQRKVKDGSGLEKSRKEGRGC